MRILIIGAGVTGSIYASYLINSKEKLEKKLKQTVEIKILARNDTYKRIKENGLKIKHHTQQIITIDRIPVISELESNDRYDYVLIFLRKKNIKEILPGLSSNGSANFVFLGNNGTGILDYKKSVPPKKIILGFPGVSGSKEQDFIFSIHKNKPVVTIGGANNKNKKPVKMLKQILSTAGINVEMSNNMDSWLKYHISLITPLAGAIYLDGGNNVSLSRNKNALKVMVKARREGYSALRNLKYPVKPAKLMTMMFFPDIIIKNKLRKLLASDMGKLIFYDRCLAAPEEMREIAEEFQKIIEKTSVETENLDHLFSLYTQ